MLEADAWKVQVSGRARCKAVLGISVLVVALGPTASVGAQELPPGGYYANGAYYVPDASPAAAAAAAAPNDPSACPVGYGVPTVYVATSPTMIRIRQIWPVNEAAPGFPYVPVYASQARC